KPIKGTIERGKTDEGDRRNAEALLNSGKDRAENLMIVDLLRNDLGKNARIGSVAVPELFALESFANVHHLVSTVTAEIAADKTPIDVLRDAFPGGSITGAPKLRAMQIIQQLEAVNRSVYCGSIGYIGADLSMDTNIAIRTVVGDGNHLHCWGGGGIVADSIASDEYAESIAKINIIMETLESY
ncbi:MAG: anthranilate synthase component I family protein, partial [Cellvibrionales bacterium]